ncbi:CYTH domain-containing protein [Catellatospora tritici]|uniref:CYTH domain-containing protein n=1 Tax=Catellatospora tritici TaxID=2851566 RepID=UPI001C2D5A84|nr:CYTH domain-containing protein [Catellatospora tritici]MBV1850544.1 CYTH domain-containing protein [Catellatospora tritici]
MTPDFGQPPTAVPAVLAFPAACDTVELKAVLTEAEGRRATASLGFDLGAGLSRQVYYLDTPCLELEAAGVIVRVRRSGDARADVTMRLRPSDPAALDPGLRRHKGFTVELDMIGDGFVCTASLKTKPDTTMVAEVLAGRTPPSTLFSPRQRRLFQTYAPPGVTLDGLALFGPVLVRWVTGTARGWRHPLTAQLWEFPGEPVLELSSKVAAVRAAAAVARWPSFLIRHQVVPRQARHTKSQTVLRHSTPVPARG